MEINWNCCNHFCSGFDCYCHSAVDFRDCPSNCTKHYDTVCCSTSSSDSSGKYSARWDLYKSRKLCSRFYISKLSNFNSGYFCNSLSVCTLGTAVPVNGTCFVSNQCALNNYCSGSYTCLPGKNENLNPNCSGVGWTPGGPCTTNGDCQQGSNCINNICTAVLLPIFPPCTPVPVYQVMNSGILGSTDLHLNSVISPGSNPLYFNGPQPAFTGCSTTGTNLQAVYLWTTNNLLFNNDYILSFSNVQPLKSGTGIYVLGNSGAPVFYSSTIAASNLVPIYKLAAFSFNDNQTYHCCATVTVLSVSAGGQTLNYTQYSDDIGLLQLNQLTYI